MTCSGPYCTSDCILRLFLWFLQELEAKLSRQSNHNQSRVDFHQFHMVFYQFQQAGNEEFQSMKKWNSAVGIVAAETNGTVMNSEIFAMHSNFRYDSEISLS